MASIRRDIDLSPEQIARVQREIATETGKPLPTRAIRVQLEEKAPDDDIVEAVRYQIATNPHVRRDLERAIAAKHGGWLSRIIHSLFGAAVEIGRAALQAVVA